MRIDLKYLTQDYDRHGNLRLYVRFKGRKVRLRAPPDSLEFADAYQAALKSIEAGLKQAAQPQHATLGWLVREYEASFAFQKKSPRDQRTIHLIHRAVLDDETKPGSALHFRDMPLNSCTPEIVRKLRDRKKATPSAANHRLIYLRVLFAWGLSERPETVKANPARDVRPLDFKGKGFHTWTEAEVDQFEARFPVGTMGRLALDLMLFTGSRRSDAVLMGPKHVTTVTNPDTGAMELWIVFIPKKTANSTGKTVAMPVLPVLRDTLAATAHGIETYLVTQYGKPFSAAGFGNWFKDRCREAGLPHCTPHGLRKIGAVRAAENGATEKQMMALFGWNTARLAAFYAEMANDKKLAAASVHMLMGHKAKNGTG